jgi:molybdopterin molybdotransferase
MTIDPSVLPRKGRFMSEIPTHDIRMRGFQNRADAADVVRLIDERIQALDTEWVEITNAAERVLADDVVSSCAVPGFDRAAMDGYAVRGQDTFGADPYSPL